VIRNIHAARTFIVLSLYTHRWQINVLFFNSEITDNKSSIDDIEIYYFALNY
jgi:hypothetical protein